MNTQDNATEHDPTQTSSAGPIVDDLIQRAKALLSELSTFSDRLKALRKEGKVEVAHFRSNVQSELSMLERLSQKPESESTNHVARSSNLPFLEAVWTVAKSSRDVSALRKRVYVNSDFKQTTPGAQPRKLGKGGGKLNGANSEFVTVDAIVNDNRLWTKISLVTNTRLLFDLAKEGWDSGGSDEENSDDELSRKGVDDTDVAIPLVKTARELAKASKAFRVRSKHPSVQLILPRVQLGETPEIDKILEDCRSYGVEVVCGQLQSPPPLDAAIESMAPDPISTFSDVLNIDCTILLALVSEFSHAKVSKEPWFHAALQRQVEIEDNENLLPSLIYPALGSHPLVCTQEAAKRMREIVDTIGTPSEKARTVVFMGDDVSRSRKELVDELQQWSAYTVPENLQLPIRVVDQDENGCQSQLSSVARAVSAEMTTINSSVFLYGWSTGRTTITSNRTVVKQIESELEEYKDLDDSVWPRIWLCPTARSLVGKEKRGAFKDKKGVQRLPDSLFREEQRRNGLDVLSKREGREVEDLRPNGYSCDEVIAAKMESLR
jgi:hypothetical protein